MDQRLKERPHTCEYETLIYEHGTHFVLPESMLRIALPIGVKFVLKFVFRAAKEYPDANTVLIQLTGDHELSVLENEVEEIRKRTSIDFRFIAAKVDDWNYELSPWKAPAVFGNEDFGDGAARTLAQILTLCTDKSKTYYIGGYSLAGLFSLWAAYQTDIFSGVAAASPSVWFPGFIDYMKEHEIKSETVYLSLGDREEKTRNPVMSQVGNCIRMGHELLKERGINCTLEWNRGNHFREPDIRTAKAFAWVMEENHRA